MILQLVLGSFILLISNLVHAIECKPVNLITKSNSPFDKMPVYFQGSSELCFAYTAAQMADYHQLSKGRATVRSVHPFWVAIRNAEDSRDNSLTGYIETALSAISSSNCDYKKVQLMLAKLSSETGVTETDIIKLIRGFVKLSADPKNDFEYSFNSAATDLQCNLSQLETLKGKLFESGLMTSSEILKHLLFAECVSDRKPLNLPAQRPTPCSAYDAVPGCNDQSVIDSTRDLLNKYSSPIGISYCVDGVRSADYVGTTSNANGIRINKSDCVAHASLIVGQRPNGNSCDYLLRDSYGTDWNPNNQNLTCLCRHKVTRAFKDNCTSQDTDKSSLDVEACWVPESQYKSNVFGITSLKAE